MILHMLHKSGQTLRYTLAEPLVDVTKRLRESGGGGFVAIATDVGPVDVRISDFSLVSGAPIVLR